MGRGEWAGAKTGEDGSGTINGGRWDLRDGEVEAGHPGDEFDDSDDVEQVFHIQGF